MYVVIQVTQDMHPVVYSHLKLPGDKFDLRVPNLTLAQFEKLALELRRNVDARKPKPTTPVQWHSLLKGSMISLSELLLVNTSPLDRGYSVDNVFLDRPTQHWSMSRGGLSSWNSIRPVLVEH